MGSGGLSKPTLSKFAEGVEHLNEKEKELVKKFMWKLFYNNFGGTT